eukprot:11707951-Heterocapsa_arctica.AAC.1
MKLAGSPVIRNPRPVVSLALCTSAGSARRRADIRSALPLPSTQVQQWLSVCRPASLLATTRQTSTLMVCSAPCARAARSSTYVGGVTPVAAW